MSIATTTGTAHARTARLGANPWLDHDSPIDAIRDDRFRETAAAATAMVDDGFIG